MTRVMRRRRRKGIWEVEKRTRQILMRMKSVIGLSSLSPKASPSSLSNYKIGIKTKLGVLYFGKLKLVVMS